MWAREVRACCYQDLISVFNRSSEDQNINRNAGTDGQAWEASDRNKSSIQNWTRHHLLHSNKRIHVAFVRGLKDSLKI